MHIASGLFEHMILQRGAGDRSDAAVTGSVSAGGPVRARVTLKNKPVAGFAGKVVGSAADGKFSARLKGLPAGGPYAIELSVEKEKVMVRDVLVGDVWISAGQSNMDGVGLLSEAAKPHPMCRAFRMDDRWMVAKDPINETGIAVDAVHADLRGGVIAGPNQIVGVGPAVAFLLEMRRVTGVPQGVIASAHGGTSMAQWDPAKKADGGGSLYGALLRRFEKNGGKVAGIIWYQGESESQSMDTAASYMGKMQGLVEAFRQDLRSPRLPVAMVQISRVVGLTGFAGWNAVQEAQRLMPDVVDRLTTVPAIDLRLDDGIHISGSSQNRLGKRLAGAMLNLLKHPKAGAPPISLKSVVVKKDRERNVANVVVEFEHVVKQLDDSGRAFGFTVCDDNSSNFVFDILLTKTGALLRTDRSPEQVKGMKLHYGAGCDPVCNIVDGADRSLPVFGPVVLGDVGAVQKFRAPGKGKS